MGAIITPAEQQLMSITVDHAGKSRMKPPYLIVPSHANTLSRQRAAALFVLLVDISAYLYVQPAPLLTEMQVCKCHEQGNGVKYAIH